MESGKGHNNDALQQAMNDYQANGIGENMGSSLHNYQFAEDGSNKLISEPIPAQTMDSIKEAIYNTISQMMFDDSDSGWGHAKNFVNFPGNVVSTIDNKVMGVGFDKYGYLLVLLQVMALVTMPTLFLMLKH